MVGKIIHKTKVGNGYVVQGLGFGAGPSRSGVRIVLDRVRVVEIVPGVLHLMLGILDTVMIPFVSHFSSKNSPTTLDGGPGKGPWFAGTTCGLWLRLEEVLFLLTLLDACWSCRWLFKM
jgi:hypothetical protein